MDERQHKLEGSYGRYHLFCPVAGGVFILEHPDPQRCPACLKPIELAKDRVAEVPQDWEPPVPPSTCSNCQQPIHWSELQNKWFHNENFSAFCTGMVGPRAVPVATEKGFTSTPTAVAPKQETTPAPEPEKRVA